MPNTTNFNFPTPADTDLVKDGASAIRSLGNSIDTAFVDLKGGTTGQVLSKASNTDLDFTWTADASGIPATIFDAKGDIIAASAADTAARLAVGANDTVLTADSSTATGLKWASPSATGQNWTLLNTGGTALTGATTITISGISSKNNIAVFITDASSANASSEMYYRFNGDTGSNYGYFGVRFDVDSATWNANKIVGESSNGTIYLPAGALTSLSASKVHSSLVLTGGAAAGIKVVTVNGMASPDSGNNYGADGYSYNGFWKGTATVDSVSITSSTGNFDQGTIYVYVA